MWCIKDDYISAYQKAHISWSVLNPVSPRMDSVTKNPALIKPDVSNPVPMRSHLGAATRKALPNIPIIRTVSEPVSKATAERTALPPDILPVVSRPATMRMCRLSAMLAGITIPTVSACVSTVIPAARPVLPRSMSAPVSSTTWNTERRLRWLPR